MIHKGDVPSVQCEKNLRWSNSMRVTATKFKSKSKLCYDRLSVDLSVLVSSSHLGPKTKHCQTAVDLLMSALFDERLELSFSGPSPVGLMTKIKVKITLRLAVYGKSVRLGAKLLEDDDQRFLFFSFFQLKPCGHSPYVTSSLTRGWVCLL
jgi:hypothetical protein